MSEIPIPPRPEDVAEISQEPTPFEEMPALPDPAATAIALGEELDKAREDYLRLLAETENFKKRVARERSEERLYASQEAVLALLPVLDNLDRALAAAGGAQAAADGPASQLAKGVELTLRQFEETFKKLGAHPIPSDIGSIFDPYLHQPLLQEPSAEQPEGAILATLQKGWKLGDRVIRPAMVKVATAA